MKRCPYCGSNQLHDKKVPTWDGNPRYAIICTICSARGPRAESVEIAKQMWNERSREGSKRESNVDRNAYPRWF